MKKIVLGFELAPTDDSVTPDSIKEALAKLGNLSVFTQAEIVVEPVLDVPQKEVVIYIHPDDEEPYLLVSGCGEIDGRELIPNEVETIGYHGICTKFYAEYPRPDRYGAPLYASNDVFAEAVVAADHGFVVSYEGLEVQTQATGDDSSERIWLTIVIPEALHAELAVKANES